MKEIKVTVVDGAGSGRFVVTAESLSAAEAQFGAANVAPGMAPGSRHRWTGGAWVQKDDSDIMPAAKATAWQRVKDGRDRQLAGTLVVGGKIYDCNREAINTAAVGAMLAKAALDLSWEKVWTLANNTSVTLSANQVLLLARACDDHITALWATARTLRAQINAATTVAAVDAINWPQA